MRLRIKKRQSVGPWQGLRHLLPTSTCPPLSSSLLKHSAAIWHFAVSKTFETQFGFWRPSDLVLNKTNGWRRTESSSSNDSIPSPKCTELEPETLRPAQSQIQPKLSLSSNLRPPTRAQMWGSRQPGYQLLFAGPDVSESVLGFISSRVHLS